MRGLGVTISPGGGTPKGSVGRLVFRLPGSLRGGVRAILKYETTGLKFVFLPTVLD